MTQEHINIGSAERAGDGESLRSAFAKIESNFIELYARQSTADGNTLSLDLIGNVLGDDSTVIVDYLNNTVTTNVLDVTTDAKINTLYTATIDTLDSSAINIIPAAIFNSDATIGNTLYTANIDTLDSSAINITPPTIFNSDVTIENTLTLTTPTDLPAGTTIGGAAINTSVAGGAGSAYNAFTPTDWNGTAPTTIGAAIDRLAALVKTLNGGTGA